MSTISKSKTVDSLLKHKLAENKDNKVILSKEEIEENVIEWTTFFRRNLDIFNNDFLEIPTHLFQNNMILTMQDNDITDDIAEDWQGLTIYEEVCKILEELKVKGGTK